MLSCGIPAANMFFLVDIDKRLLLLQSFHIRGHTGGSTAGFPKLLKKEFSLGETLSNNP